MKPCTQNKEDLTWLALDALEAERARKLRVHLQTCVGCREYCADIRAIGDAHAHATEALPEAHVTRDFHRQLERRIQTNISRPVVPKSLETFWRWVVSRQGVRMNSTAGVVIAVFALLWFKHPFPSPRPTQPTVTRTPPHSMTFVTAPPPTLSAYRMAPNWSSEALDEILGLQATQQPAVGNTRTLYAFERTEME